MPFYLRDVPFYLRHVPFYLRDVPFYCVLNLPAVRERIRPYWGAAYCTFLQFAKTVGHTGALRTAPKDLTAIRENIKPYWGAAYCTFLQFAKTLGHTGALRTAPDCTTAARENITVIDQWSGFRVASEARACSDTSKLGFDML